jgi:WD40 repeat protein/serine/threonine protein kinase
VIHCENICDRFEAAWSAVHTGSDRPRLENFLAEAGQPERESLLRELVGIEIDYRRRTGECPSHDEYCARFPTLSPDWFHELLMEPATLLFEAKRPAPPNMSGRVFGDYELLTEIARGGMGVVYKARQVSLNRIVALKMILAGSHASDADVLRFRGEAEAAANLDDPGIVPIYEVGQHDGQYFFSMGYVAGKSLAARLVEGPLPLREAAEIVRDAARAVHYAHQKGVIHRDLKPANILIDPTNRPKVTDFGLAKRTANDSSLTATGQVLGTPSYMPPEQAAGKLDQVGPLADVYALGAVLYAALTGHPPFQAATPAATLQQVLEQEPVALGQVNKTVPRDLETITLKCLEKSPPRRYATALELADDLDRWLMGQTILARRSGMWERAIKWARRRPAVAALSGGLTIVTVIAFALITSLWLSSQWVAARRTLDTARSWCEEGDVNRGLLLLDHTLNVVPFYSKDLNHAIRANLGAWQKQLVSLTSLLPNTDPVEFQVFSPDGQRLLRVCRDENHSVQLWDVAKRQPIGKPLTHAVPVRIAIFSPDGNRILTGTDYGDKSELKLWTVTDEPLTKEVKPWNSEGPVTVAAFAPDGKTVVTGSDDQVVRSWKTDTGEKLCGRKAAGPVLAVAFSPDGQTVATGTSDGKVQLWKAASLSREEFQPEDPKLESKAGKVRRLAFVHGGKRLLALVQDEEIGMGSVPVWETAKGHVVGNLDNNRWGIMEIAISRNLNRVLTGHGAFTAQLWDVSAETLTAKALLHHEDSVVAVAFSPDDEGQLLLTGSKDGTARLWEAATGKPVSPPLEHPGPVNAVAASAEGTFSTVSQDSSVRLWTIHQPSGVNWPENGNVMAQTISVDGDRIATGTNSGEVHVRKAKDGKTLWQKPCHDDEVWAVAFSTDGKLVTGGRDGTIRFWDKNGNLLPDDLQEPFRVRSLAVSLDGKILLTGSGDWGSGKARLRRLPAGNPIELPLLYDDVVDAVAFSPNEAANTCAVACSNSIRLWRNLPRLSTSSGEQPEDVAVATRNFVEVSPQHEVRVVALTFSPNGDWLASGSIDKTARLWNAATGSPRGQPLRHSSAVWSVAFSADGKFLVTGCYDGSVHVWDVATGAGVGPTWHHEKSVWTVACDSRGHIWSGGDDQKLRQWPLPVPLVESPQVIRLRTQVLTGMEFDAQQTAHWLDAASWQQRRDELNNVSQPKLPK